MPPTRIVLVEDSPIYRAGLRTAVESAGCVVVAEAEDVSGGLDAVAQHHPDCAIVDIRLPPTQTDEGIELARALRLAHRRTAVLLLSSHLDEDFADEIVNGPRGSIGYLLKERLRDGAELRDALDRLVAGEMVVDPSIVEALMRRDANADGLGELSAAERRVLGLIAEGRSNEAVAGALVISERTVNSHVRSIMRKLDLNPDPAVDRRVVAVLQWLQHER